MKSLKPADIPLKQPLYVIDIRPLTDDVFNVDTHMSVDAIQTGSLPEVACDTPLLVICQYGRVSELAAAYLEAAGFSEVYNLAGGVTAYQRWLQQVG
jgi:rhodanese-related sulfurtransferase